MPDNVEVVNVGLRLIGAQTITSLTQDKPSALAANDIFDELLDDLLRCHLWNFATKRAQLAQLATAPAFEFDHAYTVPEDWIRTVSVHPDSLANSTTLFKEELISGVRAIVTSADEVYMRYIARITDPNLWPSDFRRAFSTALARDLAVPLASSNSLHKEYKDEARRAIARAKSSDAMGSSPEQRPRGSWVRSRGAQRPQPGTVSE